MQTMIQARTELQPQSGATLELATSDRPKPAINPATLAYVNFGLFKNLCALGTSRERICAALCISSVDFDSLWELATQ